MVEIEVFYGGHIIEAARKQQALLGKPDALVTLCVPGKPWGKRKRCVLPTGTLGRIVGDDIGPDGRVCGVIAMFRADHILRDFGLEA